MVLPAEGFDPPPPSYFASSSGMSAATLSFDNTSYVPHSGDGGDAWGFSGSGLFPLGHDIGVNLNVGYHDVLNQSRGYDEVNAGASLVWQTGNLRLGPSFGFMSNGDQFETTNTYNYGAYLEYFASPRITLSALGGGFSSHETYSYSFYSYSYDSSGSYVGGTATGYVTPNLAFNGGISYARFDMSYGTSTETDYRFGLEYEFSDGGADCWWPPGSVSFNYTYGAYSPYSSYNASTFMVGFTFYTNGNGADTLVDRQRTGTLDPSVMFSPAALRF